MDCKKAHLGPCDDKLRKQELETEKFMENIVLTCYCGLKMIRSDGCNKLKCTTCRKNWCWICKAQLFGDHARTYDHFYDPYNTRLVDIDKIGKCALYGERDKNQKFVEKKKDVVVRNYIIEKDDSNQIISIDNTCCPSTSNITENTTVSGSGSTQMPVPVQKKRKERRVLAPEFTCVATKITNLPCTFKRKYGDYCGFHRK
jgi:hypothetical protein